MKREIIKKPRAIRDLTEHFHYIGMDSEKAALRFIDEAVKAFDLIADMPGIGSLWEHNDKRLAGIRHTAVSRRFRTFVIFYRVHQDAVEILAVLHGMRDLPALLDTITFE
jgi:plasmid stabilization system protein ParE